ncbi:unnamed protein product, partial [marine sediment metagenome]
NERVVKTPNFKNNSEFHNSPVVADAYWGVVCYIPSPDAYWGLVCYIAPPAVGLENKSANMAAKMVAAGLI